MKIDESIRELEKARDSIEPYLFIDEAMDQSMKTAVETMHKYQKIQEILDDDTYYEEYGNSAEGFIVSAIIEVIKDDDGTN